MSQSSKTDSETPGSSATPLPRFAQKLVPAGGAVESDAEEKEDVDDVSIGNWDQFEVGLRICDCVRLVNMSVARAWSMPFVTYGAVGACARRACGVQVCVFTIPRMPVDGSGDKRSCHDRGGQQAIYPAVQAAD